MNEQSPSYLCSTWCIWLNYQVPEELVNKIDYSEHLKKVITIRSYEDLVYFWKESLFSDPHQFMVYQTENNRNQQFMQWMVNSRFQIDSIDKNISAINYFREGINPTWEDSNNQFGGRLIFQIDKQVDKYRQIYEWLIFYFLGQSESCAQEINGIRFISHRANTPFKFHYRVEVWTKFSLSEEKKVQEFRDTFVKDFFNSFLANNPHLHNFKPRFRNNQETQENRDDKQQKNHDYKKNQENILANH